MTKPSVSSGATRAVWIALACLAAVLGWLWRESLVPQLMAFSNDAPLGLMSAYSKFRWGNFWGGSWSPSVWLGTPALPLQPSFTHVLFLLLGPVSFGKFVAPVSLLLLGLAAVVFARSQGFARPVSLLVGLAAALNTNLVSHAGWGLGGRATTLAFTFLALAALGLTDRRHYWARSILAGVAVGFSVVEGADVGAIFSLYVAAYVVFAGWLDRDLKSGRRAILVLSRLALVAVFAGWVASFAMSSLVGTQIKGVAVLAETPAAKEQRWDFATGWSFPKLETVRIAIPGLMGYRMDTPGGGAYWGNVGQDGSPQGRFNGDGQYAGVLVLMVAGWAVARALVPGGRQPFSDRERKLIGFWAVVSVYSLLLAFGRFAPFYKLVYALPYLSTIRVPMKFLHPMHLGLLVLFGYGLQGLWRLYVEGPAGRNQGLVDRLRDWWRGAAGFERGWALALAGLAGGSVVLALVYTSFRLALARHISQVGFTPEMAAAMADFSVAEVGLFAVFVVASAGALAWLAAGGFSGRGTFAGWVLGGLVVLDLARAATPYIIHYDYQRRYQSNPVVDFLARTPWEHRVTARLFPDIRQTLSSPQDGTWPAVQNQWMEQQFPYNEIHTADIWQMPRMPELDAAYLGSFRPGPAGNMDRIGRLWELASVSYIVGARGFAEELNRLFDPVQQSFKPVLGFDLTPKPGSPPGDRLGLDDITAVTNAAGQYAVIEFGRALPRAKLFPRWEVITNDPAALIRLQDPAFNPATSVVINAEPVLPGGGLAVISTNLPAVAEARITEWAPKRVRIQTTGSAPAVLLLNDRWDPAWLATVDGQPAPVLRANYLMRGVALPAGEHTVEFRFLPGMRMLWITLSAIGVALGAGVWLVISSGCCRRATSATAPTEPAPKPGKK